MPAQSAAGLLEIQQSAAARCRAPAQTAQPCSNAPHAGKRLKVGYVTPQSLCNPELCFLSSWLRHYDGAVMKRSTTRPTLEEAPQPGVPGGGRCRTICAQFSEPTLHLIPFRTTDRRQRDCLWMGVPVVTLRGSTHADEWAPRCSSGRHGRSLAASGTRSMCERLWRSPTTVAA
jgi:hypothetical protein